MRSRFFPTAARWRAWLDAHHDTGRELWVGFYKKTSGKPSITWLEAVDQALCYGWIDGIRKSVDDLSYAIRFTPRKPTSTWSAVNIKRVAALKKLRLMQPAGLRAYQRRKVEKSSLYSYEQPTAKRLRRAHQVQLKANEKAWEFFRAQPPWYRRAASWWVNSAKQEETRLKHLATLIQDSEHGRIIPPLTRKKG